MTEAETGVIQLQAKDCRDGQAPQNNPTFVCPLGSSGNLFRYINSFNMENAKSLS